MKAICQGFGRGWIELLAGLLMCGELFAQTGAIFPAASGSSATLTTYLQEQQVLGQSFGALMVQNPTPQQIQAWQQQNQAALATQQQSAMDMAADSALEPQLTSAQPNIPPSASATMKDFLTTRAALANARAQIHNQLLNALPLEVSDAQISQLQQQEVELFIQQHARDLQLQAQRVQTLAQESAQTPLPTPPPLQLPPNVSPQMAAFLTLRDQLARSHIQLLNQETGATAAARDAAVEQWTVQNASLIQQMRAMAQDLTPTPSSTQN